MILEDTYEEVYEILGLMDKVTVMKIPEETLKVICNKRNPNFKTKIDKNDIFNENNVSKEAIDILCYLDYHYWMNYSKRMEVDEFRRLKIKKIEDEKTIRYNPAKLFKKTEKNVEDTCNEFVNTMLPIEIKETNFLKKIINYIKGFFTKAN